MDKDLKYRERAKERERVGKMFYAHAFLKLVKTLAGPAKWNPLLQFFLLFGWRTRDRKRGRERKRKRIRERERGREKRKKREGEKKKRERELEKRFCRRNYFPTGRSILFPVL